MSGRVIIRTCSSPAAPGLDEAFQVLCDPPSPPFQRKFWRGKARDPFAQAAGYASMAAALLDRQLVDETGRIPPAWCAALVAEQAGKGGATVTPIALAAKRRADAAAGVEISTIAPEGK